VGGIIQESRAALSRYTRAASSESADRPALRTKLEIYCTKAWFEWSENEKPRRRSIAVYQRLFEIAQRLLQSGGHESVELVWASAWRDGTGRRSRSICL
jgi:hypothetical protein